MSSIRESLTTMSGQNYQTLECEGVSDHTQATDAGQNDAPTSGQGGTGKRAVYEPDSAQRCKQVVCSRTWAIVIAAVFSAIIIAIAIIAAFARPGMTVCKETATQAPEPQTSTPPDPDAERFPWKEIRLPDSVIPINYDIFMHPNLTTFNFKGNVSIELKVVKPTDFIVLHSKNMNISTFDMFLDLSKSTKRVGITQTLVHRRQEQIYIAFDRELQTNKRYILKMSFHAILNDLMAGFYKSSYTTTTGEKRYLAVTQFEATDARAAFPCFDEPAMKATFALTMIHEPHHISLFNMPLVDTQDYHSGLQIDKFETSVKMSTYLVAFIVCDFESIHNVTSRGTKISVYAPKEQLSQAEFALDAAVVITEYYEHFFGSPFPLPKQDLVAIPDFSAGAMENWGLITYRMTELLYDPQISTGADKQRVAVVVAHELAHQWFGNLVTMQWWNDLWLNEGFASFVEYIGADRVNPEWDMMDQFVGDAVVAALYEDSLSNSHPISIPVKDPAEINEIFDAISYSKGASIIRMLEGFIGRENLQTGLMDYLHKYKYSNAQTDDLWQCLSDASKMDVKSVMDTWTLQQGYPVVMVSIRDGSVFAQQTQFNLNPHGMQVEVPSPFQYVWKIPINFVTNERPHEASELVWMEDLSTSFKISPDIKWIKVNVNFTGYYRVHYNENIWLALTQQLQENHQIFSPADRAELIDDVFALSRAQVKFESGALMSATIALDLVRYLHQELEYVPWSVALSNIGDVASLLQGTAMDEPFKEYTKSLVSKVLETLGWDHLDLYPRRELRTMLLKSAVNINYKPAVEKCKQIFQDWMLRNISVKPEYKLAVYATGIQYGGEEEWQFMWNQYTQTIVPSEKKHMLSSLAKTTDANRMQRYLQMSLEEDKIRKQDTVRVLARISQTSAGRTLAWSFIKRNWAEFNRRYGGGSFEMSGLVTSVTALFTTQHDYTDVQTFFTNNPVPNAKRAISQSLERIQMNIDWLNRNKKSVSEWLENFSHETSGNIDGSKQTNS